MKGKGRQISLVVCPISLAMQKHMSSRRRPDAGRVRDSGGSLPRGLGRLGRLGKQEVPRRAFKYSVLIAMGSFCVGGCTQLRYAMLLPPGLTCS